MGGARRGTRRGRDPADLHGHRRRSDRLRLRAHQSRIARDANSRDRLRRRRRTRPLHARAYRRRSRRRARRVYFSLRNLYCRRLEGTSGSRRHSCQEHSLIFPCIDLMDGAVVQLIQGREKALEAESPEAMLAKFAAFPEIQVIDLDAAMGRGANDPLVEMLAGKAVIRAGGGVRTVERARTLIGQGASKVIVGTSAFEAEGPNHAFLESLANAIGRDRIVLALDSKEGRIVVKGWREATR